MDKISYGGIRGERIDVQNRQSVRHIPNICANQVNEFKYLGNWIIQEQVSSAVGP